MKCTWVDCADESVHDEVAKDGQIWARLCEPHHQKIDRIDLKPSELISNWVKAQGGAKAAAARMLK